MLKHSPLIEIFRRIHVNIEENFHLLHRSVRHTPPNIHNTLKILTDLLETNRAHEYIGKESTDIPELLDHFREGMFIMQTEKYGELGGEDDGDVTTGELELGDMNDI